MAHAEQTSEYATARLEALWGHDVLARIQASCVMVLGAGGVGSNCIEALARGGVGTLVVVDGDEVAPSNINRQAIAFADTVGMRKVDAVRAFIERISPAVRLVTRDAFVLPATVEELIEGCCAEAGGRIDYVVDAIDTVSTKLELASACARRGLPLVSSMGGAMKLYPELLRFADIYETSGDALARVMRKGCRKRGISHLDVLYSTEAPRERPEGPAPSAEPDAPAERPPLGTTSYLPPIMGQMLAGFVLRRLAGVDGPMTGGGSDAPGSADR